MSRSVGLVSHGKGGGRGRSDLWCVAVCYSVLQCITACCSVLQCVAVLDWFLTLRAGEGESQICQKGPIFDQKRPILSQKSPIFGMSCCVGLVWEGKMTFFKSKLCSAVT